jgi:hypothetical protein
VRDAQSAARRFEFDNQNGLRVRKPMIEYGSPQRSRVLFLTPWIRNAQPSEATVLPFLREDTVNA